MPAFAGDVLNPVTIGAVGVVAAIAIPNFKKARAKAQKRACLAVQRNLMAAIEMYNLDHPEESINDINPEIINKLIKGKYLAYNFKLATEKCEFEIIGDLGKGGKIRCKIHGPKGKK
jgi:type II secretory pathway pseudopilin PulG